MRWGRKAEAEVVPQPESIPSYWSDRFARIGIQLDTAGMPLSGLAISVTGDQVAVSVLGLGVSRYHSRWSPVDATLTEIPSAPVGHVPGGWERQLAGIGRLLDADLRDISDPCVVELRGGFLVTALTGVDGDRRLATWSLTKEEIAQ